MQKYDRTSRPHRRLRRGMSGADVDRARKAINLRLKRKGARTRIKETGPVDRDMQIAWRRAATLIGLPHNLMTVKCQRLMRWPWQRTPAMLARSRRNVAAWRKRIAGGPGADAVKAANRMVGKTESGYNDSAWLRSMEAELVAAGHALGWMIPGQPYCGFGCIWSWHHGPHVELPDGTVYTPNILGYAGKKIGKVRYVRVPLSSAKAGDLLPMNFGSGGAKHVGLARGPMKNGQIPTVEFNTSPGNGGSQANGGGVWKRTRPAGFVMGAVRPIP